MCRAPRHKIAEQVRQVCMCAGHQSASEQGEDMSQDTSEFNQDREALIAGASQPVQEEKGFFGRQ